MKKTARLCAMLIAVLGAQVLSAQTDVTDTYLTNPSFEYSAEGTKYSEDTKELANGEAIYGWTGATISNNTKNIQVTKTAPNTAFGTTSASDGEYYYFIRQGWEDKASSITQSVSLPEGRYYLSVDYKQAESHDNNTFRDSKVGLTITKGGTSLATLSTGGSVNAPGSDYFTNIDWKQIGTWFDVEEAGDVTIALTFALNGTSKRADLCLDNVKLYMWNLEDQTNYDNASRTNPMNVTAKFITNPYFDVNTNGWTSTTGAKNRVRATNQTGAISGGFFENWNGSSIASGKIYQTLSGLVDGIYRVTISAYGTQGTPKLKVYAGGNSVDVTSETPLNYSVETTVSGNGSLEIGLEVQSGNGSKWIGIDNVKLEYLGYDLTAANEQLTQMISDAQTIVSANEAAPKAIENLTNAIAAAQSVEQNKNAIQTASTVLAAAIDAAEATVAPYAKAMALLSICESILANSEEFENGAMNTFSAALNDAKTAIESVATDDAINTVYNTLETAREAYVVKADPTNGISFDYTFFVTNPGFDNDKDGWTSTGGAQNKAIATNKTNGIITGKFYENWNGSAFTGEIYQTVSNLPSGIYKLKIAAFGAGTNVYANDLQTAVTTSEGAWYEVDQVKVGDGTLKFGIKNENANTWMGIDNVSLYYNGFDVETAQNRVTNLKEEAKNLLTPPMGTSEAAELNAAIAAADASKSTRKDLSPMIDALETAIGKANEWTRLYNEAKAPLLALLEMFESKYNDGENGCLYTVDEDSWNALIVAVTAANTAKDVNNDYSGFAAATESLKAAFVPVDASIMAYPTENKKSATASDMTNYYLVNASFDEENTNGWVKTGSQTNNVAWSVTDGTFKATPSGSHYTGDAIWQKVTLPKGAYKLSVNVNADEVEGHSSYLFASTSAPVWNNTINDLLASAVVENYNEDVTLTCIFSLSEETIVYVGFNQTAGNRANTGIQGSYTIYDFTLTQAANQISTKDGVITVVGENEAADLAGISSDENIVKVDLTGAIWSEASTLDINNKNSLVYVTDDANLIASNIVKVGVDEEGNTTREAKSIVLTEGYKFYAREAFTTATLEYAREFSANWLTVCLPFAYEIPENVKVETLGAVDLDTKTFTFNEVTGTMEANKPYIIKNSSETAALFAELGDVAVEATPEAMTIKVTADNSEHEAEFIGTYTAVKTDALMEDGVYDILFFGTDGQLYYLSQGTTEKVVNIKPFRAYIRLPKGAINWSDGQQAIARHGEGTTDIEDAELTNEGAPAIYDLMGRKVTSMEKDGMYIVNGKKVIVK